MAKRRKIESPSIHIVECHNEALDHIYRAIGSKLLPLRGITLLHFDSHPDLGIPTGLKASDVYTKHVLLEALQIENWILPAAYAGHIDKIVWFKSNWADQIPEGDHVFWIGKDPRSGEIRVSSTLPYFLTDCLFVEDEELEEKKEVILHVVTLNTESSNVQNAIFHSDFLNKNQAYVLDIDLDFFSTCNPFRQMFSKKDLATLTELYWFEPPKSNSIESIKLCQDVRLKQLNSLEEWLTLINNGETRNIEKFEQLERVMKNYENSLERKMDEEEIEILHGAGCATDEPELPHHVSSDAEIDDLMRAVQNLLKSADNPPKLITIARSTEDGYCPREQVDDIQEKCEAMLRELYDVAECIKHYLP